MTNSEDFSVQNFQSLIEKYEAALREVTGELETVQEEQQALKSAFTENNDLRIELQKALAENAQGDVIRHRYKDNDLIENLKLQLKSLNEEKENAVKLWQNATNAVEQLETELRVYQENSEGFIPKSKYLDLKHSYEEKITELQAIVKATKSELEKTINLNTKELQMKDREISGTIQSQSNSFQIVRNLEDEVLNLQRRLSKANDEKKNLEEELTSRINEIQSLKNRMKECTQKVEEALQVVEAALNEKDAALLREADAKEEAKKLAQALNEFMDETDEKIKMVKQDHDLKLEHMRQALETSKELIKVKNLEIENHLKRCKALEIEIEKIRSCPFSMEEGVTTKMLILEKNLENTFQKLLHSEKMNIQLKSEVQSVKADLEQMSHYYERDISSRDAEKAMLNKESLKLKKQLDVSLFKVNQSQEVISDFNQKISAMELDFREKLEDAKAAVQQAVQERKELENVHQEMVNELREQLKSQTEINKKWRKESKIITDQLESIITGLKGANDKLKNENKLLNERLKEANAKMLEYKKFLELVSHDVSKITRLPESDDIR